MPAPAPWLPFFLSGRSTFLTTHTPSVSIAPLALPSSRIPHACTQPSPLFFSLYLSLPFPSPFIPPTLHLSPQVLDGITWALAAGQLTALKELQLQAREQGSHANLGTQTDVHARLSHIPHPTSLSTHSALASLPRSLHCPSPSLSTIPPSHTHTLIQVTRPTMHPGAVLKRTAPALAAAAAGGHLGRLRALHVVRLWDGLVPEVRVRGPG